MENAGGNDSVHLPGICLRSPGLLRNKRLGVLFCCFLKTGIIQRIIREYYSGTQGDFKNGILNPEYLVQDIDRGRSERYRLNSIVRYFLFLFRLKTGKQEIQIITQPVEVDVSAIDRSIFV